MMCEVSLVFLKFPYCALGLSKPDKTIINFEGVQARAARLGSVETIQNCWVHRRFKVTRVFLKLPWRVLGLSKSKPLFIDVLMCPRCF